MVMGHMIPRERDLSVVDIESGGTTSEEEGNKDPVSTVRQTKKYLARVWSGIISLDEHASNGVSNSSSAETQELFIHKSSRGEDNMTLLANKTFKEKRKKAGTKKPPKPPRPPGGPSLGVADQKLVREISELAMLKRARAERIKAQKKIKAAKSSSSSSNSSLCAMIVTILFCLIIIFQGMLSRSSSHARFEGSPESATISRGALISVQYYKNPSASSTDPSSGSPNLVEQVSGSGPEEERSRVAG